MNSSRWQTGWLPDETFAVMWPFQGVKIPSKVTMHDWANCKRVMRVKISSFILANGELDCREANSVDLVRFVRDSRLIADNVRSVNKMMT